jgi:hypothetical protein
MSGEPDAQERLGHSFRLFTTCQPHVNAGSASLDRIFSYYCRSRVKCTFITANLAGILQCLPSAREIKNAVRSQTRRARVLAKPQPRSPSTPCMDAVHINWNRPPSSLSAKCPISTSPWGPRSPPGPNNRDACRIVPSQALRLRVFAMWLVGGGCWGRSVLGQM